MSRTTQKKPRRKQKGMLRKIRAKTQSATVHLTREDDWDTEVPNVRLSRVFAIVLILHVVAVGGILAFQLLNPDGASTSSASSTPPAREEAAKATGGGLAAAQPKPPKIGDPAVEGLRHYRVQSGDSLPAIARRFSVPIDELERLNKLDSGNNLYPGLILYLPNRTIAATKSQEVQKLLASARGAIVEPNNKRDTPGTRVPLAIEETARETRRPSAVGQGSPTRVRPLEPVQPAAPVARAPLAEPEPEVRKAKPVRGTVKIHTVAPGDTPFGLGRQYGIAHDRLLQINGIDDPTKMQVGMKLKIPVQN